MKRICAFVLIGFASLFWMGAPAEAVLCTAGQPPNNNNGVIDSLTLAAQVVADGGINDPNCAISITFPLPTINIPTFSIIGKTLTIIGSAATPVTIVNSHPTGTVILKGTGDVKIDNASIKARKKVDIDCAGSGPPLCEVHVTNSELIATSTLDFGGSGGVLEVTGKGDVEVTNTSFTAGDKVFFQSFEGSLTISCRGGSAGGCQDPLLSGVVQQLCPQGFPCNVDFADAAALRGVCFPVTPPGNCDGGRAQKDFFAKEAITCTGLDLTADRHVVFNSKNGPINCQDANIVADGAVTIAVDNCTVPAPCINLDGAIINSDNSPLNVSIKSGCATKPGTVNDIVFQANSLTGRPGSVKVIACGGILLSK